MGDSLEACSEPVDGADEEPPLVLVLTARPGILRQFEPSSEGQQRNGNRAEVIAGGLDTSNANARLRLVLLDLGFPPNEAAEAVKRIRHAQPGVPFILFNNEGDCADFVKAAENGTADLMKACGRAAGLDKLLSAFLDGDQAERPALAEERIPQPFLTESVAQNPENPKMRAIRSITRRVSQGNAPVLLEGGERRRKRGSGPRTARPFSPGGDAAHEA